MFYNTNSCNIYNIYQHYGIIQNAEIERASLHLIDISLFIAKAWMARPMTVVKGDEKKVLHAMNLHRVWWQSIACYDWWRENAFDGWESMEDVLAIGEWNLSRKFPSCTHKLSWFSKAFEMIFFKTWTFSSTIMVSLHISFGTY